MGLLKLPVGLMDVNCYVIYDNNTKDAIIVDPGFEGENIINQLKEKEIVPKKIFLTHGHGDHIGAVLEIISKYDIPLYCHKADIDVISNTKNNHSRMCGLGELSLYPDDTFSDGEIITLGNITLKVLHTPGHTKGGVCFFNENENYVLTGDTLFRASIGRTDFYGGDYNEMISSIKNKLLVLKDTTEVHPGHGPSSSIGFERNNNPFLK